MGFTIGKRYSRREISDALGGSIQSYLPTKNGQVLCGCFKPIREYNPDAPEKVTTGGVGENAEWVSEQAEPIPIFLFRSPGAWEDVGRYRCTGLTKDPDVRRLEELKNPVRGHIAGVLYFVRVRK